MVRKIRRNGRDGVQSEEEENPTPRRWLRRELRETEPIKTVEIDTSRPFSYVKKSPLRHNYQPQRHSSFSHSSPLRSGGSPITPSPTKTRPLQVHSAAVPNYMAATASAKARLRSQSAPRQRHSASERAKKRLSFPNPDPYLSDHSNHEQRSYGSFCNDSMDEEIYPPSTTNDLRWWIR